MSIDFPKFLEISQKYHKVDGAAVWFDGTGDRYPEDVQVD